MRPSHLQDHRPRSKLADADYFRLLKDRNSALLRSDILERRSRFRGLPEVVSLCTSDLCNLRCTTSPRPLAQGTRKLDRTALERVCHELFPTARKAILTAAAGEPLLADFDVVLRHALHYGVKIDLRADVYARCRVGDCLDDTCWLQHFGALDNGDVHTCCMPTDHRLGNVHDDDAASIWNSAAAQRLRRAHFDRAGTPSCSDRTHAPHLATAPPAPHEQREARVAAAPAITERDETRRPVATRAAGDHPRVFYVCNWSTHAGGIEVLYDHVAGLRALGVDARLGAYETFERCDWFDHDPAETPAQDRLLDELLPADVVVLPEICMWDDPLVGHPARQIVFVQNPELMTGDLSEWRFERVLAPSAVLDPWIRELQGFDGAIDIVPGHLPDSLVLPPRAEHWEARSGPRVLLIDRVGKHDGEVATVFDALRAAGFDVTLHDETVHRSAFAALFAAHDIYVHLSRSEGFPVSILEAFGAGALVVGFAGRGGLEFMRHGHNCYLADDGDVAGALRAVAHASTLPTHQRQSMLRAARETARHWTLARQRAALGRFAETLRCGRRGRALRSASAPMAARR